MLSEAPPAPAGDLHRAKFLAPPAMSQARPSSKESAGSRTRAAIAAEAPRLRLAASPQSGAAPCTGKAARSIAEVARNGPAEALRSRNGDA
mmetsp:Transcript_27051/g.57300  ORF Transcript_27051/g.57300 Transcript_27051/m.57300 type:complete len:91 (-) Transcript_27051:8-280(-)